MSTPAPTKKMVNKYRIEKDKKPYDLTIINDEKNIIIKLRMEKPLKIYETKLSKNDLEQICNIFKGCEDLTEVYSLLLNSFENKQYEFSVSDDSISIKINKIHIFEFKAIIIPEIEIDISEKVENLYQIQEDLMKEINDLKKENENLKKQCENIKKLGDEYELININLLNGASNYGSGYNPFKVYKFKNSLIKLSGLINCTGGKIICQLPNNCRPKGRLIFNCMFNGGSVRVDICVNGDITNSGSGSGWLSLDNILFVSGN